ncbi:MAG: MATE family efflux transporter [Solobacterium sp.]|nr:MATE family efflux transporter [Solobacterium sp.]
MTRAESVSTKECLKETIRMAWPAVLESVFIHLASMIDTMMVSTLGTYAVSAVGLTSQPKFIYLSLFLAVNIAVSALVARRRGQKKKEEANRIMITAILFSAAACLVVTALSLRFMDHVLRFAGSNSDTHVPARIYFNIIQGGMIFNVLSLVINAAQRGSGNTRIAMITNVVSSIVNILFNYLLINGHFGFPALGLKGAAIATVLGTVVACILSAASVMKRDGFVSIPYLIKEKIRPSLEELISLLKFSFNLFLENLAMRVGFMYTALMAARLGTDAFAAHNVGMNFLALSFSFGDGMQVAAVALIGRSLGEKRPELAKQYGSICQKIGLFISFCISLTLLLGGRQIFSLFFTEPHIMDMGLMLFRFIMIITLFQISQIIYAGCLRGAGDVRYTMFGALLSATIIRSGVTWLLSTVIPMGLAGIWLGALADQISRFTLFSTRFRKGDWVGLQI